MKKNRTIFILSLIFNLIFIGYAGYKVVKKVSTKQTPVTVNPSITTYKIRSSIFKPISKENSKAIIFLGDSLTDNNEWDELFNNPNIENRGISGDTTKGMLDRIAEITNIKPQKVFIMAGINDIGNNESNDTILNNYKKIVEEIKVKSPNTQIFIQSTLPINNDILKDPIRNNQKVKSLDNKLKELAQQTHSTYINLYDDFIDKNGNLISKYTVDGLHVNGDGYAIWKQAIEQYVDAS